ncbi:hypothetical protein D9M71_745130 [compost metagenome]
MSLIHRCNGLQMSLAMQFKVTERILFDLAAHQHSPCPVVRYSRFSLADFNNGIFCLGCFVSLFR